MTTKFRWGILGTGRIARKFAASVATLPDAVLAAVGSRSAASAEAFDREFQIPVHHSSYAGLANDPAVDGIYIATPSPRHAGDMRLCLEAGKPVLCEKPFTVNSREANEIIALARARRVLLMEALWTRFLPAVVRMRELIAAGRIGPPQSLVADIGFPVTDRKGRLLDPAQGGGALLDVGVYPVSLASMLFGPAIAATGYADIGDTGVDEAFAIALRHAGGKLTLAQGSFRCALPLEATVSGPLGYLRIPAPWWKAQTLILAIAGKPEERWDLSYPSFGLQFEAAAFAAHWRAGRTEASEMPLDETLSTLQTLDQLRAQWGLRYPGE